MTFPPLILASQSPARKRLLRRLGYKFRAIPAHLDEESYQAQSPRVLVQTLAREKAKVLAEKHRFSAIIGSDQMLVLGQKIFGKPHTFRNAVQQLSQCSGKTVQLLTAIAVIWPDGTIDESVDVTEMTFHKLKTQEIEAYVEQDQPLECAGSFMFEKNGLRLFSSISTDDPTAIEGLPCLALNRILRHSKKA